MSTFQQQHGIRLVFAETISIHGGQVVVDSSFSEDQYTSLKKYDKDETLAELNVEVVKTKQETLVRKASEWCMQVFQENLQRLKNHIIYEEQEEKRIMLWSTVLHFKICTRLVVLNHIFTKQIP